MKWVDVSPINLIVRLGSEAPSEADSLQKIDGFHRCSSAEDPSMHLTLLVL